MKKKLNTNYEIYNYLNITNRKLGKIYKYTGTHCLPADFDVNADMFKERLFLNEMERQDIFPPFVIEEKKEIKKRLKNSIKNIQKLKKYAKNSDVLQNFSQNFIKKFGLYLDSRHELSHAFLKDFESQSCDEVEMYRELFNLDPVFGEFLDGLFDAKPDFSKLCENLEEKYEKSYVEKLKLLDKKTTKQKKERAQRQLQNDQLVVNQIRETERQKESPTLNKKSEKSQKPAKNVQNAKIVEQKSGKNTAAPSQTK